MTHHVDPCLLYLGTQDGLRILRLADGDLTILESAIEGNVVRDISVHPTDPADVYVGCGLRGWGLYHTRDGGNTVEELGFEDRWVWGVTRHPRDPETVYVGTEPPMLYHSTDGGEAFESFDAIDDLPSRDRWTFFHEPFRAGHVHGITIHPDRPERLFAGVEHGALIYTHDGGETWDEALAGSDLHRIAIDPGDPDHVLAATGAGLSRSVDAGETWETVEGLRGLYLHSVAFDGSDRVYVYADRDGDPLYRSEDGGHSWTPVGEGLPAARPADTLRLHPTETDTLVYAGDGDDEESHVFLSTDAGESWTRIERTMPKIWRLEVAPDDSLGSDT